MTPKKLKVPTSMTPPRNHTARATTRTKLALWSLFLILVATSMSFGMPRLPATTPSPTASHSTALMSPASATSLVATHVFRLDDSSSQLTTSATCTPQSVTIGAYLSSGYPSSIETTSTPPSGYTSCSSEPVLNQLLPINRWGSAATTLTVGPSGANPIASAATDTLSTIASALFSISSFVWSLTYDILQFALTHDIVQSAAQIINTGYTAIAEAIWSSGVIWLLIFFVLATLGFAMIRGDSRVRVMSTLLALIIPIAAIQAFANIAAGGSAITATPGCSRQPVSNLSTTGTSSTQTTTGTNTPGSVSSCTGTKALSTTTDVNYHAPTGSPAWLAVTGLNFADDIAAGIASTVSQFETQPGNELGGSVTDPPSCIAYSEVLYADYAALEDAKAAQTGSNATLGSSTLTAISSLWEAGYLSNWITAEFSSGPDGEYLYCHYLDGTNAAGISQNEQSAINVQAYGNEAGANAATLPTLSIDPTSINPTNNAILYGYAACYYDGSSWQMQSDWSALIKGSSNYAKWSNACQSANWSSIGRYGNGAGTDQAAFNAQQNPFVTSQALNWDTLSHLQGDYSNDADQTTASTAFNTVETYMGNGVGGSRILSGLTSLATSLAYGWALLGLGLGSIVAQMGLVAMMILLPGTLFLLALPRKKNGNANNPGVKLLRMTAGFFASRLIITVVLTVLIYLTLTISSLISALH